MTREDMKKQVLARVKLLPQFSALGERVLDDWLKGYRADFNHGPNAVLSAERELRRALSYASRPGAKTPIRPK